MDYPSFRTSFISYRNWKNGTTHILFVAYVNFIESLDVYAL